jgi:hypothetical protein
MHFVSVVRLQASLVLRKITLRLVPHGTTALCNVQLIMALTTGWICLDTDMKAPCRVFFCIVHNHYQY